MPGTGGQASLLDRTLFHARSYAGHAHHHEPRMVPMAWASLFDEPGEQLPGSLEVGDDPAADGVD
jgi:hypothetical protein